MIKLTANKDVFELKNQWDELSPEQAVKAIALYLKFEAREIDFDVFRLELFRMLTGYKRSRKIYRRIREWFGAKYNADDINSRIMILANMLTFVVKPRYAAKSLELIQVLSADLQGELETRFPFEICKTQWLAELDMISDQLVYKADINIDFGRNLMPTIELDDTTYKGPLFSVDENKIAITDIKVNEFVDAFDTFNIWNATENEKHLDEFIAILYRQDRAVYDLVGCQLSATRFASLDKATKMTVVYFFLYVKNFIFSHPYYTLLLSGKNDQKMSTGWDAVIQQLSGAGYGSKDDIRQWDIIAFFNAQFNGLKKSVGDMRQMGYDDAKIANKMDLSLETVLKL